MYRVVVGALCALSLMGCTEEPTLTFAEPELVDETTPDGVYEIGEVLTFEVLLEADEDYDEMVGLWVRSNSYHGHSVDKGDWVERMEAGDVEPFYFRIALVNEDAVYPDEVVEVQFDVDAPSCLFRGDCPVPFQRTLEIPVQLPQE